MDNCRSSFLRTERVLLCGFHMDWRAGVHSIFDVIASDTTDTTCKSEENILVSLVKWRDARDIS